MPKSNLSQKNKKENRNLVYLDYAASVSPNSGSIHREGIKAKIKLEEAREKVSKVLGCRSKEVIFTSGGTESNNLAIQGVVWAQVFPSSDFGERETFMKPHIITTNIEHPSVLETFKILEKRKLVEISIVPVEKNGIVDPKKIGNKIKKNTVLVSVMYANNEVGTIQPIREIAKEIRRYKKNHRKTFSSKKDRPSPDFGESRSLIIDLPFFHTDAVQAPNYLDLKVEKLGVDLFSLSGTKIEKSGRVGVLYKRDKIPLLPVFGGGDQEMGLRPGTENLPEIIRFSRALQIVQKEREKEFKRVQKLRDYFLKRLSTLRVQFILNGDFKNRLPNNLNITFPKIPSDLLVIELSARGIMSSSKSACKSSKKEGSYVVQALRADADPEIGGIRFSLGKDTKKSDIDFTIKALKEILQKLEKWYN